MMMSLLYATVGGNKKLTFCFVKTTIYFYLNYCNTIVWFLLNSTFYKAVVFTEIVTIVAMQKNHVTVLTQV